MCLFFREHFDEGVKISNTSACNELQQFVITVSFMDEIQDVLSLWPCDAPSGSELGDKGVVRVHTVHQVDAIDAQLAYPSYIDRPNTVRMSSDICNANTQ